MDRTFKILAYALPAVVGLAAAGVQLRGGGPGVPVLLMGLAGALLGWGSALLIHSAGLAAGLLRPGGQHSRRQLAQLQQDKAAVLRALKDLELDASMQRMSQEEREQLARPLREKAKGILRQLDQLSSETPGSVDDDIELEVARRLESGDA